MYIGFARALYQAPYFKGEAQNLASIVNTHRENQETIDAGIRERAPEFERVRQADPLRAPLMAYDRNRLSTLYAAGLFAGLATSTISVNSLAGAHSPTPTFIMGAVGLAAGITVFAGSLAIPFYDGSNFMINNRAAAAVEGFIQDIKTRFLERKYSLGDIAENLKLISREKGYDVVARLENEIEYEKAADSDVPNNRLRDLSRVLVLCDVKAATKMYMTTKVPSIKLALEEEIEKYLGNLSALPKWEPADLVGLTLFPIPSQEDLVEKMLNRGTSLRYFNINMPKTNLQRLVNAAHNSGKVEKAFSFQNMDLNDQAFIPLIEYIKNTKNPACRLDALKALEKYLRKIGPEGINYEGELDD